MALFLFGFLCDSTFIFFLIGFPLIVARRAPQPLNPTPLLLDFPEALFFWSPNYYFDRFLRRTSPGSVPYRPLLADVLRAL